MKKHKVALFSLALNRGVSLRVLKKIIDNGLPLDNLADLTVDDIYLFCDGDRSLSESLKTWSQVDKKTLEFYKRIVSQGIHIMAITDNDYPVSLREFTDPPLILYIKGDRSVLSSQLIGMVGTRNSSPYGDMVAKKLGSDLVKSCFTVVSGLAAGIDTMSHEGALQGKGQTIAVLGTAIDRVYPSKNAGLSKQITEHGALVSEYPPGFSASKYTFPQRNRIIAGLCKGVVIVEAPRRSGAMITAHLALDHNREVFCIPGRLDDANSQGPLSLIQQGASCVLTVDDILSEFNMLVIDTPDVIVAKKQVTSVDLNGDEKLIINYLGYQPVHVDSVVRQSAMSIGRVNAALSVLELNDFVEQRQGRYYVRV
jgi:DNA processing protein